MVDAKRCGPYITSGRCILHVLSCEHGIRDIAVQSVYRVFGGTKSVVWSNRFRARFYQCGPLLVFVPTK
ncbi:unnamed protein product [Enterobius vermicularis]|uniref:Integrase n=1 Tax=Enterobius vermicularis TaxID=51028 RepID=A0A0N4VFX0_ENTVE|nr:unnamed protein product [Enterobius vermicularis]